MSTTVSEIVAEAISRYPNIQLLDDATIARRLTQIFRKVYPYIGEVAIANVDITEDGAYSVATDFRSDNLKRILLYNQDDGGVSVASSRYRVVDIDEARIEEHDDKIYLHYLSDTYSVATVYYLPEPSAVSDDASDWDLTDIPIDDEYADLLVYKLVAELAIFGDIPDVAIANNYEMMYQELFAQAKADYYRRKQRNNKYKIKHEDIW